MQVVSRGSGVDGGLHIGFWQVARSVLLFLGVPLAAGIATRYTLLKAMGKENFDMRFMPYFGSVALLGLIYTIIVMFSLQGHQVGYNRWQNVMDMHVVRCMSPIASSPRTCLIAALL